MTLMVFVWACFIRLFFFFFFFLFYDRSLLHLGISEDDYVEAPMNKYFFYFALACSLFGAEPDGEREEKHEPSKAAATDGKRNTSVKMNAWISGGSYEQISFLPCACVF